MTISRYYEAVLKRPDEDAQRYRIDLDPPVGRGRNETSQLRELQRAVGGYIEALGRLPDPHQDVICYVNEEGKLHELPFNFVCGFGRAIGAYVLGPAIFCGSAIGGDLRSLTDVEVDVVLRMFGKGRT